MASPTSALLLTFLCILAFCLPGQGVHAFGAGNIPGFAYLEGKAFRHGDIEDILAEMAKTAVSSGFALGALLGSGSGKKFKALDVKRVYFGNWLRDYSQAVDTAGLGKLQLQTIVNLVMVLGFMAHGYATGEFEVTIERLGVYLPTEHIDNPKGYPDNAQTFDSRLRGPVNPRELEIDTRTGMKNYIANESGGWDTSKALVRRVLQQCIDMGRRYNQTNRKEDHYEAYRLLGQALHTMEDFAAHSNFCELALVAMGHTDVFVHVGDRVRIQAPSGKNVAPLVTGTFGSSDFIHSLLGEASDHINQASVVDLNAQLDKARSSASTSSVSNLRDLLNSLPDGSGGELTRQMAGVEKIRAAGQRSVSGGGGGYGDRAAYGGGGGGYGGVGGDMKSPDQMNPQELHDVLWQVLSFRDAVMKKVSVVIEKIPGLSSLLDRITDSVSVFVLTTLEPFLKPIMKQATTGLSAASGEVIDNKDQYEVFDKPNASDPTHSFLSKDHFNLILNEPAGHLGMIIVQYTVSRIVKAWDDKSINPNQVTDDVLHSLFHPDFHIRGSEIQRQMLDYMKRWVDELGSDKNEVLRRLTKQSVRNHRNVRIGHEGVSGEVQDFEAATQVGTQLQNDILGVIGLRENDPYGGAATRSAQPDYSSPGGYSGSGGYSSSGGQSGYGYSGSAGHPGSGGHSGSGGHLGSEGHLGSGGYPGSASYSSSTDYSNAETYSGSGGYPGSGMPSVATETHSPHRSHHDGQGQHGGSQTYYGASETVRMPGEEIRTNYGASHAAQLAPPPRFPSAESNGGYAPSYVGGGGRGGYSDGAGGYGGGSRGYEGGGYNDFVPGFPAAQPHHGGHRGHHGNQGGHGFAAPEDPGFPGPGGPPGFPEARRGHGDNHGQHGRW